MSGAAILMVLIVTGQTDLPYHDWRQTTPFLRSMLEKSGCCKVQVVETPQSISRQMLAQYDVVLLNYNGPRWGGEAEQAMEDFVRSGKGLVAFHGATYGPLMGTVNTPGPGFHRSEGWTAYSQMLGAIWEPQNIGHARRHTFSVNLTDSAHPIAHGMESSFTVDDELYHRITLSSTAHVIADAFDDPAERGTGRREPIAWTVAYGRGRTFYSTLGHDTKALGAPGVITLLTRAVRWTGQGELP